MTAEQLQDIKVKLREYSKKDVVIKKDIIRKIEECYFMVQKHLSLSSTDTFSEIEIQSELSFIGGLLDKYSKDTEYLTKDHMIRLNVLYKKYK